MPPTGGDQVAEIHSTSSLPDSRLANELRSLPAVSSLTSLYCGIRGYNSLIDKGLGVVESGWFSVVGKLADYYQPGVVAIDSLAGDYVAKLKYSYPIVQEPPSHLIDLTKRKSLKYVRLGTRCVMESGLGQMFMDGLDSVIRKVDKYTESVGCDKAKRTRPPRTPRDVSTPSNPISSKSPCGIKRVPKPQPKETYVGTVKRIISTYGVVYPLKKTVSAMKSSRRFLRYVAGESYRRNRPSVSSTPRNLDHRRKLSPHKRLPGSTVQQIKNAAMRMLGYETVIAPSKQSDIRNFLTCDVKKSLDICPRDDDTDRKRKHDECLDENDSDDEDDDLENFDYENYQSDEDPDYENDSGAESTDSMEYQEGDTESDIEDEFIEDEFYGDGLKQIKAKQTTPKPKSQTEVRKPAIASSEPPTSKPVTVQFQEEYAAVSGHLSDTTNKLEQKHKVEPSIKSKQGSKVDPSPIKSKAITKVVEPSQPKQMEKKGEPLSNGKPNSENDPPKAIGKDVNIVGKKGQKNIANNDDGFLVVASKKHK